jgi:hypothetical protein
MLHTSGTANQTSTQIKDELSSAAPPGTTLLIVETVPEEDIDIDDFSASSLDEILDTDFSYNEGFGMNSIRVDQTPALPSGNILHNNKSDTPNDLPSTPCKDYLESLEQSISPLSDPLLLHQVISDDVFPLPWCSPVDFDGPRGHLDNGAQASTTHEASSLHNYRLFTSNHPCRTRMIPADGLSYTPIGYGTLRLPAPTSLGYIPVFCYHAPELKSTIVSPRSIEKVVPKQHFSGTTLHTFEKSGHFTFLANNSLRRSKSITLHGILSGGLCYTGPLLLPIQFPSRSNSSTSLLEHDHAYIHTVIAHHEPAPSEPIQEFCLHKLHVKAERLNLRRSEKRKDII